MAMLTVDEALRRVLALAEPIEPEEVEISDALGRASSSEVASARTMPATDLSAMDGYAVGGPAVAGSRFEVVETVFAGQRPQRHLEPNQCARIMTGASIPRGTTAVVMQEHVRATPEWVEVLEAASPRANIRARGEDVEAGAVLLRPGSPIGLAEAGLLWSQGYTRVAVHRRPRVAIATSGDELRPVGSSDAEGVIDSNSPMLAAASRRAGAEPTLLGIAPDRLEALEAQFARGLRADVLIAIAGASVGERDFTKEALQRLGVAIDFWKVAMKPGKPLALGRAGRTLVFGLPGNPVSALVTFELFVRPALRALAGLPTGRPTVSGRSATAIRKAKGLRHFVRATAELREGVLWARPLSSQSSGSLVSAAGATHLVDLPEERATVAEGDEISLIPVDWIE